LVDLLGFLTPIVSSRTCIIGEAESVVHEPLEDTPTRRADPPLTPNQHRTGVRGVRILGGRSQNDPLSSSRDVDTSVLECCEGAVVAAVGGIEAQQIDEIFRIDQIVDRDDA
jgi:hypothetical protein